MHASRKSGPSLAVVAAAVVLVAACGGSDDDDGSTPVSALQACASLANKTIAGATVAAAVSVAASGPVPQHCKVSAKIEPSLNFEMRLPNAWNGKLHYGGGGGFGGLVRGLNESGGTDNDNHGLNLAALQKGYVNVVSDAGHQGKVPGFEAVDGSWAPGNPAAERLYAELSVPTVISSAVEMIKAAYGTAPTRSYFEGCSNGGREALIAAQRFPNLFDGVIARAPVMNFVASVGAFQRNMRATVLDPTLNFTPAKITLLSNAVLAACDGLDGIADGVVSNAAACTFDAASARSALRCAGGADAGDSCLSDAQLGVVDTWNAEKTFAGRYVDPGWPLSGSENVPGNWDAWLFGGVQFAFQYGAISGLFLHDPATQPLPPQDATALSTLSYDFDAPQNAAALAVFSNQTEANDPDLRPFMNSGGKLLLWHGGADPALTTRGTNSYYEDMLQTLGGQSVVDGFARYYVAPGVNHCQGGAGADKSDLLDALDAWVSNGIAPGTLAASQLAADGSTNFTRPLCRYPQYPRYTGLANDAAAAKLAANYVCTTP